MDQVWDRSDLLYPTLLTIEIQKLQDFLLNFGLI
jgi:hypothetical protein